MEETRLNAGRFSDWLADMQAALRGEHAADVPCDGCTACCTSSQFVHIEPDEAETLAHIPRALLFPAPGAPKGHTVLGYDDNGHCPMLVEGRCSIYEHRPRACRTYDCRIFAATGILLRDERQAAIRERADRWQFDFLTDVDREQHDAVRAAARFVDDVNPTQRAVLVIEAVSG
jgi:Fe-S-cluster containining protein